MSSRVRWHRPFVCVLLLGLVPALARAELGLSPLFSDGVVLQREKPIVVWGVADREAQVTVTFEGTVASSRAAEDGRWRVELPGRPAGGPFEMTVTTDTETRFVRDILIGDVWVCSGQSNMEWVVADSMNASAEIALASDPTIRHFKVPRSWAAAPQSELAGGSWTSAAPGHVGAFSAVGYFFARELRRHVDVPIGLLNATWGGSRIEAWMSAEALEMDGGDMAAVLEQEKVYEREVRAAIAERVGSIPEQDQGMVDGRPVWADPDLQDSAWEPIPVPSSWEAVGYPGMDGVGWYRTSISLSPAEAAAGIALGLGAIDDSDITRVNGHEVGRMEMAWNQPRLYEVPPEVLRSGKNVVAIRVEDTGGGGGIQGQPGQLFWESGGVRRSLAGDWKFRVGYFTVDLEDHKREVPTVLYNHMVHPLLRFPVRGVLWYQGESNAGPDDAFVYRDLFARMIRQWRLGWGVAELPFLFVQLAGFMEPAVEPRESSWALLRESQAAALELAATAQVLAIDLGDAFDVHPLNKQAVGYRLALAARHVAYGQELVFSGPVYAGHEIKGSRVILSFDHLGSGLVASEPAGARLRGFAIAGEDRHFVWANATIEGDRVIVWHADVTEPVAVRFGWADNPEGANLQNREGLPAASFRTDSW